MKNKFFCKKCGRHLTFWEIFKLNFGSDMVKEFHCKCGNKIKFKENVFLKYLPVLFAGTIVFFNKNFYSYFVYILILLALFILYFITFTQIEEKGE